METPTQPASTAPPKTKSVILAFTLDEGALIVEPVGSTTGGPRLVRKSDTFAQLVALIEDPTTPVARRDASVSVAQTIKDIARAFGGADD